MRRVGRPVVASASSRSRGGTPATIVTSCSFRARDSIQGRSALVTTVVAPASGAAKAASPKPYA